MWKEAMKSRVPSPAVSETCENTPLPAKTSAHLRSTWCPGSDILKKASSSLQGEVMLLETWGCRCCGGGSWKEGDSWLEALPAIERDTSEEPTLGQGQPEGLRPRVTQVRGQEQQRETSKKHAEAKGNQYTRRGRQKPVASPKRLGQTECNLCGKSEQL